MGTGGRGECRGDLVRPERPRSPGATVRGTHRAIAIFGIFLGKKFSWTKFPKNFQKIKKFQKISKKGHCYSYQH